MIKDVQISSSKPAREFVFGLFKDASITYFTYRRVRGRRLMIKILSSGCKFASSCRSLPLLQRNLLCPSSGRNMNKRGRVCCLLLSGFWFDLQFDPEDGVYIPPKHLWISTRLHGLITEDNNLHCHNFGNCKPSIIAKVLWRMQECSSRIIKQAYHHRTFFEVQGEITKNLSRGSRWLNLGLQTMRQGC